MKTIEQIARETVKNKPLAGLNGPGYKRYTAAVTEAIEADRKQRDIYELIAEALDERAENWDEPSYALAAQNVRDGHEDDYIWDEIIGPMLDAFENRYRR